jgi:hypothetical protein
MGLFSLLGKAVGHVAKEALDDLKESTKEYNEYKDYCSSRSFDDLCSEVNANWNSEDFDTRKKATAAYMELKKRGYTADDVKAQR